MEYCSAGREYGLNENQFLSCFLITLKIFGFFFMFMPFFFVCTASSSCLSLYFSCQNLLFFTTLDSTQGLFVPQPFFSPSILVFLTGNFSHTHTHTRRRTVYISSDVYKVKLRHNMICLDVCPIVALCGANVGR